MSYAVRDLAKSFGPLPVLENISFSFDTSSIVAILGPSGCGKTTILNILSGLVPADSGALEGFGGRRFSYCFQEPRLLDWMSAEDNLRFALAAQLRSPQERGAALSRIDRFLAEAGLSDFKRYNPRELSGGMQKRLALARAFASPSDILLLDEAFSAVDLRQRLDLMRTFLGLWSSEKPSTVIVTHDIHDALYLAHTIIVLSGRPARVVGALTIELPHSERDFASDAMARYEVELYRLLGFDHAR